jgi:hypothetical protein
VKRIALLAPVATLRSMCLSVLLLLRLRPFLPKKEPLAETRKTFRRVLGAAICPMNVMWLRSPSARNTSGTNARPSSPRCSRTRAYERSPPQASARCGPRGPLQPAPRSEAHPPANPRSRGRCHPRCRSLREHGARGYRRQTRVGVPGRGEAPAGTSAAIQHGRSADVRARGSVMNTTRQIRALAV